MPSLLDTLRNVPVAVVDVETTGASPRFGDRVTEVGVVRYENGQIAAEWQRLVDPQRHIAPGVVALTGITQAMVDGQPTFSDRLCELAPLLEGAVVVGHNVSFDLNFLASEFRRCGMTLTDRLGPAHVLDTVRLARRRFGRSGNGLQNLAHRFGIAEQTAHRALADARTTGRLLELLIEPIGGWDATLVDALAAQGGPVPLEKQDPTERELPLELIEALETRGTVRMTYLDARSKQSERVISPLEIRRFRNTATLIAHCHLRGDRRTFKLDRIVSMTKVESE